MESMEIMQQAQSMLKTAYLKTVIDSLNEKKNPIKEKLICRNSTYVAPENTKIGRNTTCPCGSGKKYKNCCLKESE